MPQLKSIGYVGLGIMGRPMSLNLLKAGYDVTVWNRTAARCHALGSEGAAIADSPADLARRKPEVICINVTDTPDVEQVLFGEQGIAPAASPGLIVVDHSTINPVATQDFARRLADRDVTLVDAPVSGGDVGAQKGTLSIMVGGPADAVERVRPMLEVVGSNVLHVGDAGMGQACKACNQVAVTCTLMGLCEALALAKQTGLDAHKMLDAISGGAAGSWQMSNLGPRIADGDFNPGFMIDLVLKDLNIVNETAAAKRLALAGTSEAERYFRIAAAHGHGKLGTQAMAKALEQVGGFEF
ncbi:MAG: NAD(P)-dependent oxidoreductase [Phycisphaeraceae bacterium]